MPTRWTAPLDKHRCRRVLGQHAEQDSRSKDRAVASASRKVGQNQIARTFTTDEHDERMHFASGGGSGRDDASEERMLALARRMNTPENEIPQAVATSALLARTDDVAIALIGAHAYTFGLRFDLVIRLRHEPRGAMAHRPTCC